MSEKGANGQPENKPKYELAKLGDGEVFVAKDSRGDVRMIAESVTLSPQLGDVAIVQGKAIVTKDGYMKINRVAGINLLTPPSLIIDGVKQCNPHVERDPKTKTILSVAIRRMGIGYTPVGNMLAIDKFLYWNIRTYFIQDLQAKMKKFPACAVLGIADKQPQEKKYKPIIGWGRDAKEGPEQTASFAGRSMVFYMIEEPVGIWIDLNHPEIQAVFDQHTQRQKFGDRIAQSIIDRNIIADFTAIKRVQAGKDTQSVRVNVYGWKHAMDFRKVDEISGQIAEGSVDQSGIEHRAGVVEVEAEEVEAVTGEEAEAEEAAETRKPGTEAPPPALSPAPTPAPTAPVPPDPKKPAPATPPPAATPAPAAVPPSGEPGVDLKTELMRARAIIGKEAYTKTLREKFNVGTAQGLTPDQQKELLALCHAQADKAAA